MNYSAINADDAPEQLPVSPPHGRLGNIGIASCCLLIIGGNAATIIAINFWLNDMPLANSAPQLAILVCTNAIYFGFFTIVLCVLTAWWGLSFTRQAMQATSTAGTFSARRPMLMLCFVGALDVMENFLSLYATPTTPEVLQALLQCSIPFFTLLISVGCISEERKKNFRSPLLVASSVLLVAGITIASYQTIADAAKIPSGASTISWIAVYVVSCVIYAGWAVSQRVYLDRFSAGERTPTFATTLIRKVGMLVGDTGFQLIMTFALLPSDAIPWFGTSDSVQGTWGSFSSGVANLFATRGRQAYGLAFVTGYLLTYIGEAFLAHHSPTMSSVVLQMSSPVTAILLIAIPALNAPGSASDTSSVSFWLPQIVGLFFILAASILFEVFERRANRPKQSIDDVTSTENREEILLL